VRKTVHQWSGIQVLHDGDAKFSQNGGRSTIDLV
jgi:hypothetical protein